MNSNYENGKKLFQETDEAGIQAVIHTLNDVSPHISRYIIEFFGQVFNNPVLTYQQREMIVISALTSLGDTPNQLKWHMNFGLKVGITPNEIIEIATHCIPFCGAPRALNAITVAKQLFAEQNIEVNIEDELLHSIGERRERGVAKLQEIDGKHGEAVADSLAEIAPVLAEQIIEFAFGEIYSRSGLNPKQRQLVTLGALTAQGGCETQLHVHLNASIRVGLTRQEVIEALLQCYPYTGFPKVLNAVNVAKKIFLT
ncbi:MULTISPECIES: carboxymuconolactone decarboxylase family protein [Bacillus]|uniref:carboxymuconolactone decarboxylase family protein n=1 Tax=Bacillus TaxID=1386 RepID=UPI0004151EF7|nr:MULTISPECIES: carboxymuconolactone decarboxylase family protein [Bacillus]QHZ44944.1 carboxymuconolactone decarboxylase family protein [Bacillus sp. NSP9.1]